MGQHHVSGTVLCLHKAESVSGTGPVINHNRLEQGLPADPQLSSSI